MLSALSTLHERRERPRSQSCLPFLFASASSFDFSNCPGHRRFPSAARRGRLVVFPDSLVEKSPSDPYKYRALTLPNGLRVLLASDPKVAAAA